MPETNRKPATRILIWALCVGAVSFAAGFFGPIFFSNSNLGPLLGIFVTGPLGALVGAVIGALRSAKDSLRISVACIGLVWLITLLYTFLCFGLSAWVAAPAVPLQLLVVASCIFLLSKPDTRSRLPDSWRRFGPIAIAAQLIILLMTLFPPVVKPWWIPAGHEPATPVSLPPFAFILDQGFDASRNFPQFAVNRPELASEWIIAAAAAVALCLLMQALRRRPAA